MSVYFELKNSFLIGRSNKYEGIYEYFNNKKIFSMSELFTLCAVIGFTNNRKVDFRSDSKNKGKDIRSEYFANNELMNIYTIMIKSQDIKANIDDFANYEFIRSAFRIIEQYAEGGMEILCEDVFCDNWDKDTLLGGNEKHYEADILNYINAKRSEDKF